MGKRISLTSGMVRFGNDDEDDQNADDSSSSSSQEDGEEPGHWSGDEAGGGPKQDLRDNMSSSIRRKSIGRKPIRSKSGRQSSTSLYSITTISSEENFQKLAASTSTEVTNTQQTKLETINIKEESVLQIKKNLPHCSYIFGC